MKFDLLNLPNSCEMTLKRLLCLEEKLKLVFRSSDYNHITEGYIRKCWFLAICNKNKPGTSRIVWDATAKTNGVSPNSFLYKNPDLLASLPAVLFSFRFKVENCFTKFL